jgi:hypothetical protein
MPKHLITPKLLGNIKSLLTKHLVPESSLAAESHIKKLRKKLTIDAYNTTCSLLCDELVNVLNKLMLNKSYSEFDSSCPFFQKDNFRDAFNRLIKAIMAEDENSEAKILMIYYTIRFIYEIEIGHFSPGGIKHSDVINFLSSSLNYVGQCKNSEDLMKCMSDVFSSALGVQIKRSSDLKNTLRRYKKSPLSKSNGFDDRLLVLAKIYHDRSWSDPAVMEHHEQFIKELMTLRETYIKHSIERKHHSSKYNLVMQHTTKMLQDLNFGDHGEEAKEKNMTVVKDFNDFYQDECKKMFSTGRDHKFVKFTKAVGAIMLTGLTYLSVAGAVYAQRRHIDIADYSKKKCGLDVRYSLNRYLTFKSTGVLTEVKKISESASIEVEDATKPYSISKMNG